MNLESVQEKLDQIDLDKINNANVKEILDEIVFALDLLIQGLSNNK